MGLQEKVSSIEFEIETGLDVAGIRTAGQQAAEAGRRFLTTTVVETGESDAVIGYAVRGPGGLRNQMELFVQWTALGDDRRQVSLSVGDYVTHQQSFMFIPLSPRTAPALTSARRFAAALAAELSGS